MKKNNFLLIGGFILAMVAVNAVLVWLHQLSWQPPRGGFWDWKTFGTMVGAAITVAVMTQLYKDNPLFKLAEHMLVGSALGYGLVVAWYSMWVGQIIPGFQGGGSNPQLMGKWSIILPAVLGLAMYSRLSKKYTWVSRVPYAVMIGFGVGMAIPADITSKLLLQLKPMMIDLVHDADGQFAWPAVHLVGGHVSVFWGTIHFKDIAVLLGVMSTLVYFFFSLEHKGPVGAVSKIGVWFLMIAFGASFGYTVQGRLSLLIGRINFLFRDWIPLIP